VNKKVCKFDADGFAEVSDPKYIERMKKKYEVCDAEEKPQESKTAEKKIVCKKCGEEFTNQGLFLAHCRKPCGGQNDGK
jgi:formylmethanofuran dehydrogenase subunit E